MQQLHLVGFTTDLDSLIFSARKGAKSGGFVLPLDERLLETIADAVRRRVADGDDLEVPAELLDPAPPPRRQSQLSPREIQDRLRAGRSLEAIAAEARVGEEWVARFAAPVEAERAQIVGRARALVYAKPRRGDSAEVLGTSVRWNLADRGVRLTNDEFDDGWSAYQIADHAWMVTFGFVSRKREQEAEWEVDLATGDLVSRNRLASDLGYVEPGRRRRSMASLQPVPLLGTKGARRIGAPIGPVDGDGDDGADDAGEARPAAGSRKGAARPVRAAGGARRPAKKAAAAKRPAKKAAAGKTSAARKAAASKRPAAKATAAKKAAGAGRTSAARPAAAKRPAQAVAATKAATRAGATRSTSARAAKRTPARKVAGTAKRAAKATRKAAPPRPSRGRDVPGAIATPEVVVARPEPNELGQRRLQLATGAPRPAGTGRPGGAPAAPPRASTARSAPPRIAATRSIDRPLTTRPTPAEVAAAPPPVREAPVVPAPPSAREPELDVIDDAAAERRRAERRAARAAARASGAGGTGNGGPRPPAPAPDVPEGDGRVVTIRANRATPPTGETDGEVVIAGDRPPLRPAQPAAQPRRRRFARPTR